MRTSEEDWRHQLQEYGFIDDINNSGERPRGLEPKPKRLRELGKAVRPLVREMVEGLRRLLQHHGYVDVEELIERSDLSREAVELLYATTIAVPVLMVAEVTALLATVPAANKLGRPRKPSTEMMLKRLNEGAPVRAVAKQVAAISDEPSEDLRSRMRSINRYKPKRVEIK